MKARAIVFFVLVMSLAADRQAQAYTCFIEPGQSTERLELANAIAVFTGVVTVAERRAVTFDVDRVWKGAIPRRLTMAHGPVTTSDGTEVWSSSQYTFTTGGRYVVFAFGPSIAAMRALTCTNTAPMTQAAKTVEILDTLVKSHPPLADSAGVCMAEGTALVGTSPVRVGKSGPTVKRLPGDPPRFDDLPRGSRVRPGPWMGEILIGTDGRIVQVWPLREIEIDPPLPSYNETIRAAVRSWTYTTPTLNGTPTPACMTVTVTVDWQ